MKRDDEKIEQFCKFCENAGTLSDPDVMLCKRHGVVSASHVCRKFRYDPLKREPKRMTKEIRLEYVEI